MKKETPSVRVSYGHNVQIPQKTPNGTQKSFVLRLCIELGSKLHTCS
jgi:hypothetical protein